MVAAAEQRAAADGLDNIDFHEMDAEALRFGPDSFDAATCVCGLMFCPDPHRAIVEIRRVLKSHGRFGIVVWDAPSRNPFLTVIADVASRFMELQAQPGPAQPGPFRLAESDALDALLRGGGFSEYAVEDHTMTFALQSADE